MLYDVRKIFQVFTKPFNYWTEKKNEKREKNTSCNMAHPWYRCYCSHQSRYSVSPIGGLKKNKKTFNPI